MFMPYYFNYFHKKHSVPCDNVFASGVLWQVSIYSTDSCARFAANVEDWFKCVETAK